MPASVQSHNSKIPKVPVLWDDWLRVPMGARSCPMPWGRFPEPDVWVSSLKNKLVGAQFKRVGKTLYMEGDGKLKLSQHRELLASLSYHPKVHSEKC